MERRDKFLYRKNFFAAAIITTFLWISLATVFFFVPPNAILTPIVFLILVFLTVFFTGSLLFANTRRGLLLALGAILYMVLRYFDIGNYLNLILLAGVFLSIEYYLSKD